MEKDAIIKAFDEHIQKSMRQYYREFYCGITDNVEGRLFNEHNVSKVVVFGFMHLPIL